MVMQALCAWVLLPVLSLPKCTADVITNWTYPFSHGPADRNAVAAGIFGILIGIPVLRLKGDYLAIVTLAFGEIIKNLVNVLYIGKDSQGLHFSIKDVNCAES